MVATAHPVRRGNHVVWSGAEREREQRHGEDTPGHLFRHPEHVKDPSEQD